MHMHMVAVVFRFVVVHGRCLLLDKAEATV
jgi:hypothetical protein